MSAEHIYLQTELSELGRHKAQSVHWHFRVSGHGPLLLLACHGFSQGPEYFDSLTKPLEGIAQVWAVELPGHGKTSWPGERPASPHDLLQLLRALKTRTKDPPLAVLGFSMGGRYAMALGQTPEANLHSLHLAAPEGLSPNWAQIISTETAIGRWIIQHHIDHPGLINNPVAWLERSRLVSKKMADFVRANVASRTLRIQLRESWIAMSGLKPDRAQLARQAASHKMPVHIYAGKRDPLINMSRARAFAEKIPEAQFHPLDKGHFLIDRAFGERLAALMSTS